MWFLSGSAFVKRFFSKTLLHIKHLAWAFGPLETMETMNPLLSRQSKTCLPGKIKKDIDIVLKKQENSNYIILLTPFDRSLQTGRTSEPIVILPFTCFNVFWF